MSAERQPLTPESFISHMRAILPQDKPPSNIGDLKINPDKIRLVLFDTPAQNFNNDPNRGEPRVNRRAAIGLYSLAAMVDNKFGTGSALVIDMDSSRLTPLDAAALTANISRLAKQAVTVGINMFDPNYYLSFATASALLQIPHDVNLLLVGGRGFTLTDANFLKMLPESDTAVYGFKGEAEEAMVKILKGDLEDVALVTKNNTNATPAVLPVSKLQSYPPPNAPPHEATDGGGHLYHAVNASRSCVYHRCNFCASSYEYPYRGYPLTWLTKLIGNLTPDTNGISYFAFNDDNALGTIKRAQDIFNMMEQFHLQGKKYVWRFLNRGDMLLKLDQLGILQKARELGVEEIAIGVESADDDILRLMNKGESHAVVDEAIEVVIKSGIKVKAFTMIGYLGETREQMEKTIRWLYNKSMKHHNMFRHSLFVVAPYEGTPLQRGLLESGFSWADLRMYTQAVALEDPNLIKFVDKHGIQISSLPLKTLINMAKEHNYQLDRIQKT